MDREYRLFLKHFGEWQRQHSESKAINKDGFDIDTEEYKTHKKNLKKSERSHRKKIINNLFSGLFATAILWLIIVFIYQITVVRISWSIILIWICSYVLIVLSAFFQARPLNKEYSSKRIKAVIDSKWENDPASTDELWEEILEIADEKYPKQSIKQILSDKGLEKLAIVAVTSYMTLIIVFISIGLMEGSRQHDYWIYTDGEKQYAVVYQSDNQYILKEVNISGNDLFVDLSKERIIQTNDILLEYHSFSQVVKISEDSDLIGE